ncbi:MAG: outer membrane protein [Acidiferrobacterales bacterium]
MRKSVILWFLLPFLTVTSVLAQEKPPRYELTPFGAYQGGGEFEQVGTGSELELDESGSFGLVFNRRVDADRQWEIFYSRQETELDTEGLFVNEPVLDLDVDYLQFGGTYAFDSELGRPYIVATIGVSRFDPEPSGFDSETFFSFSFGGGVKLFPDKRFGLRLEGRFLATVVDSDSEILCRTGFDTNFCAVRVEGDLLWQWQMMAGLIFRF